MASRCPSLAGLSHVSSHQTGAAVERGNRVRRLSARQSHGKEGGAAPSRDLLPHRAPLRGRKAFPPRRKGLPAAADLRRLRALARGARGARDRAVGGRSPSGRPREEGGRAWARGAAWSGPEIRRAVEMGVRRRPLTTPVRSRYGVFGPALELLDSLHCEDALLLCAGAETSPRNSRSSSRSPKSAFTRALSGP